MAERQNGCGLRIVIALAVAFGLGLIGVVAGVIALSDRSVPVDEGSALEITLDGAYTEGPGADPLAELGLAGAPAASLWEVRTALRAAATDDRISGVLLTIRSPQLGMGQAEELASELERFRTESNKPVHALIQTDLVDDNNYYLASAASKVWVSPEAWWMVNGLQAEATFWRGTLDWLKIEPEVIMFKEYKSAGEPFQNYEMSDPMREALADVLDDIHGTWVDEVAARRSFDRDDLAGLVNQGTIPGARALEIGLADALGYRDQVEAALQAEAGTEEYAHIGLKKYLAAIDEPEKKPGRVAVIFAEGPIVSDEGNELPFPGSGAMIYGPEVADQIREAADDEAVRAIVLRVNSPGGSAVGSDLIWREIERAQADGTPVVISMSSVAASGGYWLSMGADRILAHDTTLTGSIGVVFTKLNVDGFYEWMGANIDTVRRGDNAGLLSPFEGFTESQREQVVQSIGATYDSFVAKVADGRGMEVSVVEPLARGRVWSGTAALDHGLIDEIGGLDAALTAAAELAGEDPSALTPTPFPEPKELFELLMEGELGASTRARPVVDPASLEAWVRQVSAPRVQALAPSVRFR